MQHLALLYYGLSLTTGCVSIGIALLINTQYRKEVIRFYVLFLGRLAAWKPTAACRDLRECSTRGDPPLRRQCSLLLRLPHGPGCEPPKAPPPSHDELVAGDRARRWALNILN